MLLFRVKIKIKNAHQILSDGTQGIRRGQIKG